MWFYSDVQIRQKKEGKIVYHQWKIVNNCVIKQKQTKTRERNCQTLEEKENSK